jgi:hypothetical protein
VARVRYCGKISPNYFETHVLFGGFTFVARKFLGYHFFWKQNIKKQPVIAERQTFFQKQLPNSNAKPFPKEPIPY